ncbi:hypothetical protein [Frigidibacter mobilis]|uniref:Tetratricopeptide repeat-like domain-containing protein n=1 Tax=Frigidibacter mobilis TaxID=1335048 RepID=A0A159Z359_9RHOB|nr:hypothetical protein [Frigidibacter mobilis]AMY69557.1 hypothetical protein AKL17_2311 [Frigidibacter mobilis]
MSDTDSFIDEVTEEVRRDRLFAAMRRYGWIGILLVVAIVAGAAVNEWQKAKAEAEARAFGDALMAAMAAETPAARAEAVAGVPAAGPERAAVQGFLAAASLLEAGDTGAALAAWDGIAANGALPVSYRHLALLKRVIAAGPEMPASERGAALDMLAAPGAPYRMLALEQQALDLVAAGEGDAAVERLRALLQEPGVTSGLRRRATQLMVALGAEPGAA